MTRVIPFLLASCTFWTLHLLETRDLNFPIKNDRFQQQQQQQEQQGYAFILLYCCECTIFSASVSTLWKSLKSKYHKRVGIPQESSSLHLFHRHHHHHHHRHDYNQWIVLVFIAVAEVFVIFGVRCCSHCYKSKRKTEKYFEWFLCVCV